MNRGARNSAPILSFKEVLLNKFDFYKIDENYIKYLENFDNRVSKSYDNKSKRPFIGIVLKVEDFLYFAPFTSPKKKHLKMKNSVDFLKLDEGKLGAINFNNMIPVPRQQCIKIDVQNEKDIKYKMLLYKQIKWCNKKENTKIILNKAAKLYEKVNRNKVPLNIINRCCNFKILEEKSKKYTN